MNSPLTILYDGWPLVYEPNHPAALHLYALLTHLPATIQASLALPAEPGKHLTLPNTIQIAIVELPDTPRARLSWEQRRLPDLAHRVGAQLVHLTHAHPALFASRNTVISPTSLLGPQERTFGLPGRLRAAVSAGGMASARGLFWPGDLPAPDKRGDTFSLPPFVHPDFSPQTDPDNSRLSPPLPETFILYHGPYDSSAVERLLSAWTWGAGALGELYPLVLLGTNSSDQELVSRLALAYQVQDVLQMLPLVPLAEIPAIYQACTALFHPAPTAPWGGAVRHALACGKPVVALESPMADALVGPAAYLVSSNDARSLGAALITVIVETELADQLAAAAVNRSAHWRDPAFSDALHKTYRRVLGDEER
jgi:glycosyltransferase involved in cell wall biosynthesis